jgi:hypothetical protein
MKILRFQHGGRQTQTNTLCCQPWPEIFSAIPVSIVSSKSAFNLSGRILGDNRSSMTPQTLEALVCGKDWLYKYPSNQGTSHYLTFN